MTVFHIDDFANLLKVKDDTSIKPLLALGFQVSHRFDDLSGDPVHWMIASTG